MNPERASWARRYETALRRHLQSGTSEPPPSALSLGSRAVTLGLETLDVVQIHAQAVASLISSNGASGSRMAAMTQAFFAETIVPIEKTHPAARKAAARVDRLTRALRQRTREARISHRELKRGVVRRQAAEAALQKSGEHGDKLLAEARRQQRRLRRLTRELLKAQEDERRKTSQQLYNELAQALLAIDLRLLSLRKAIQIDTRTLRKEIADTERLVIKSNRFIRKLSHEGVRDHET